MTKLFCDWCADECKELIYLNVDRNPGGVQKHEVCSTCNAELDEHIKEFIKVRKDSVKKEVKV